MATESNRSVVDIIKSDHAGLNSLFETVLSKQAPLSSRQEALNQIVVSLSEHSSAEEILVYPAIRKVAKNPQAADRSLAEHQKLKEALEKLRKMSPDDPTFDPLFQELVQNVRNHVREEETKVLPDLELVVSPEDLVKMGGYFVTAKKLSPPTPHPNAPNVPPYNVAMAPIATFLDKLKQYVKGEQSSAQA